MVTARQKALVEASWGKLRPVALQVAELFYDRLFELDPLLEDMFEREVAEHGPRLMRAIGAMVSALGDSSSLLPIARDAGRRHAGYGVRPGQYATFGRAWLWTLEQSLGEEFTPSLEEAWASVYALVSSVMIEAAEDVDASPSEPKSGVRRLPPVPSGVELPLAK